MKHLVPALAAATIAVLPLAVQAQEKPMSTTSPKEQVAALLKSLETRDAKPVGAINPDKYIQHNLAVADGLAGIGALLQAVPKGAIKVQTVRVFQDGDHVFAHSAYEFFGPKIGFDIFRFENGRIVEHWDNLQETPTGPTRAATP